MTLDQLDALILSKISGTPRPYAEINTQDVWEACAEFDHLLPRRQLDNRITELKRAGKIRFNGHGWVRVLTIKPEQA